MGVKEAAGKRRNGTIPARLLIWRTEDACGMEHNQMHNRGIVADGHDAGCRQIESPPEDAIGQQALARSDHATLARGDRAHVASCVGAFGQGLGSKRAQQAEVA